MTKIAPANTPWHQQSFYTFIHRELPHLLAQRVPLAGYAAVVNGDDYCCTLKILLASKTGEVAIDISNIPHPDIDGVFDIDDRRMIVPPVASSAALHRAKIKCVGEQLLEVVARHLGTTPPNIPWSQRLAHDWLPIDVWVRDFVLEKQRLEEHNWLNKVESLRMILVPDGEDASHPEQIGYACPIHTPEGRNIGKILQVAIGAEIRDGRMMRVDDSPEGALSLAASMIPFIEYNDTHCSLRALTDSNMMRQWRPPSDPEPALVQTGTEPDDPAFWCGRNLLTAFLPWGAETCGNAVIISESAARRINHDHPLEVGERLSNRHGHKGIVSRIVPDDQMPHLPDGTSVDVVSDMVVLHTYKNFGQVREALASRIARAEGKPFIAPPFHAPSADELRDRLKAVGLEPSGMEWLTDGQYGPHFSHPTLVGWVYWWGRTYRPTSRKISAATGKEGALRQGELEYAQLREAHAFRLIREHYAIRNTDCQEIDYLSRKIVGGEPIEEGQPAPQCTKLIRRLNAAGIHVDFATDGMKCRFTAPAAPTLVLAQPVPHPWVDNREIQEVGIVEQLPEFLPLVDANERVKRRCEEKAPSSMIDQAIAQLCDRTCEYMDGLLRIDNPPSAGAGTCWTSNRLMQDVHVAFSGRAVIAPDPHLRFDQIGIPEEIAWTLYGPFIERKLGRCGSAVDRDANVTAVLDQLMAEKWVVLNRAPSVLPMAVVAFHAVRTQENVIRLPALACMPLNAQFDGEQAAIFLPLTSAGQADAGEKLSLAGHLRRDPSLLSQVIPSSASMWGLAHLSRTRAGHDIIERTLGVPIKTPNAFITRDILKQTIERVRERKGVEMALEVLNTLTHVGFKQARTSGASISPFIGTHLHRTLPPQSDYPELWKAYSGELAARITSHDDFDDPDMGPQALAYRSRASESEEGLMHLLGPHMLPKDTGNGPMIFRRGLAEGLTPHKLFDLAMATRRKLKDHFISMTRQTQKLREAIAPSGYTMLARAMRAGRPGIHFAWAAAMGEVDPLTDLDVQLFVGLADIAG